ncbi:NAD-binding protein [Mycena pura]|uniref:NAD-binding protein n=1 Tax=Mycena pura TaxID=153505 RepID=A0AAD6VI00_9AGAR|nr:NAD-binding protein [Mycena pura]
MSSSKGTAIVTGAAQGIGRAIALRLADDGFDVALNDISVKLEQLETLAAEIKQKGRQSSTHVGDVSQEEDVKRMITQVAELHEGVDVMVANAGIIHRRVPMTEFSVEEWDQVMNVNARGVFLCYKYAGLQMIKQGRGGRIIGASSINGKQARPDREAYSASKFAVRGLTQSAAQEFGPHAITVNAYAPGAIDTPMMASFVEDPAAYRETRKNRSPLKKIGVPEDMASLVSFLASKESRFITGQTISINGGLFFD